MQHGAGGYCEFLVMWLLLRGPEFNPWACNFFFNSKDPITLLYWCENQFCSASLSAYIHFSDSALSTLTSAEHSDQCWTDLSGPLLSPFPANLAGEGRKLTLISADQESALADQRWSEHVGERQDLPWVFIMPTLSKTRYTSSLPRLIRYCSQKS